MIEGIVHPLRVQSPKPETYAVPRSAALSSLNIYIYIYIYISIYITLSPKPYTLNHNAVLKALYMCFPSLQ